MWAKVDTGGFSDDNYYSIRRKVTTYEYMVVTYIKRHYESSKRRSITKLMISGLAAAYSQLGACGAARCLEAITDLRTAYGDIIHPESPVIDLSYGVRNRDVFFDFPRDLYSLVAAVSDDWGVVSADLTRILVMIGLCKYSDMRKSMSIRPEALKEIPSYYVKFGVGELDKLVGCVRPYVDGVYNLLAGYFGLYQERIKSDEPELYDKIAEIISSRELVSE